MALSKSALLLSETWADMLIEVVVVVRVVEMEGEEERSKPATGECESHLYTYLFTICRCGERSKSGQRQSTNQP